MFSLLTHWGRVTHICVGKLTIIGPDNGLSPGRRQAIMWTNAGILLIEHLGTNLSEILIKINTFSFKKMYLKMSSGNWRPFCFGLNMLTWIRLSVIWDPMMLIWHQCYVRVWHFCKLIGFWLHISKAPILNNSSFNSITTGIIKSNHHCILLLLCFVPEHRAYTKYRTTQVIIHWKTKWHRITEEYCISCEPSQNISMPSNSTEYR